MFFYGLLIVNKYAKKIYTYSSEEKIEERTLVLIEFGVKKTLAIVESQVKFIEKSKRIEKIYKYKLEENYLNFIKHVSDFNFLTLGSVLELVFPTVKFFEGELELIYEYKGENKELLDLLNLKLSKKLIKALNKPNNNHKEIKIMLEEDQIKAKEYIKTTNKPTLLYAVTGAGKTIVALESIANLKNKILILVPEINLSKNWIEAIKKRFGKEAHIYNSKVKETYKKELYKWIISDYPGFIVGTRSALMLPYKNLEAIIIDEEHSLTYKQERYPYYQARDMAVLRSYYEKNKLIMLSATPSIETYNNVIKKKYDIYKLKREPKYGLAEVIYEKGDTKNILSSNIIKEIQNYFEKNQQVMFFLNRKGYIPYCICNNCQSILSCNSCNSAKTLYKNYKVICNKCLSKNYLPKSCPECNDITTWKFFGIGIEKLYEYLKVIFPNYNFLTISCDSEDITKQIEEIEKNKVNGIIATQILAQGYDFKNIGLVIIVDADMGIYSTDFRATERIYQLWQQVRGRSGRHNIKGKMIIQYQKKDNRFITLFQKEDILDYLLKEREEIKMPPFSKCAFIKFKSRNKEHLEIKLSNMKINNPENIFGPLYYGQKKYIHEFRFLVKAPTYKNLFEILSSFKESEKTAEIEIDPYIF